MSQFSTLVTISSSPKPSVQLNQKLKVTTMFPWTNCCVQVVYIPTLKIILSDILRTCNTLLESPVFWESCLRSLASGLWFMAKYDFMARSWWCLKEVRMRFGRARCSLDVLLSLPRAAKLLELWWCRGLADWWGSPDSEQCSSELAIDGPRKNKKKTQEVKLQGTLKKNYWNRKNLSV